MMSLFFFNDTATTEIYTLSLHRRSSDLAHHDALPGHLRSGEPEARGEAARLLRGHAARGLQLLRDERGPPRRVDDPRSEEHTSELQSRQYLVCRLLLEKKIKYLSSVRAC